MESKEGGRYRGSKGETKKGARVHICLKLSLSFQCIFVNCTDGDIKSLQKLLIHYINRGVSQLEELPFNASAPALYAQHVSLSLWPVVGYYQLPPQVAPQGQADMLCI